MPVTVAGKYNNLQGGKTMKNYSKLLLLVLIILLVAAPVAATTGYRIWSIPLITTLTWHPHTSLGLTLTSFASDAANTWNAAPGNLWFARSTVSTGNIVFGDTRNDVGYVRFSQAGLPVSVAGIAHLAVTTVNGQSRHRNFDLLLNADQPFGSGNSQSFNDWQGVFTHEFGHAVGLDDLHVYTQGLPIPTMYGFTTDILGRNITFDWRTLEIGDRNGKADIASRI